MPNVSFNSFAISLEGYAEAFPCHTYEIIPAEWPASFTLSVHRRLTCRSGALAEAGRPFIPTASRPLPL